MEDINCIFFLKIRAKLIANTPIKEGMTTKYLNVENLYLKSMISAASRIANSEYKIIAVNNANLKSAPVHSEYISNVPK